MNITIEELMKLFDESYVLYDLRAANERNYGYIPESVSETADGVLAAELPKDKKIVLYCTRGVLSKEVAEKLRESGFDAYSLDGGYFSWIRYRMQKESDEEVCKKVEQSIRTKFKSVLMGRFIKALKEYKLVNEGDKIAVCMSGGKDSMLMAKLFQELKRYSDVNFEVKYLVMDPGYNAENRKLIEDNARRLNIPITIYESNIFESVYNVEKSPCYLCARMRRGYLYNFAKKEGCNKIALGHHYDDVIETILMGMLYSGQFGTMMPKLHSENFEGMELIRPMYFIREDDIIAWRDYNNLQFLRCACKFTDTCTTCNNGDNHSKRLETKELIRELKKVNPTVEQCIFRSSENVSLETVLAYKKNRVKHSFLETYDDNDDKE